jgi:methionine aminopeptidase
MDNNKPKVKVSSTVADFQQKQQNVKLKQSNFFLTINTNQRYGDNDAQLDNDTEYFKDVMDKLLNNIDKYVTLPPAASWDEDVKDVTIESVVEKGGEKNCLHCHAFLKFTHTTDVKLNYAAIKQKICGDLGLPNIYMMNRVSKGSNENILEYMNKYNKQK